MQLSGHQLFNIRVYGILVNEKNEVLVTDEIRFNTMITKFPGGGLRIGESLPECLKREWMEECEQEIEVEKHFYTTDFYQPSAFDSMQQVISIYYKVKALSDFSKPVKTLPFDFEHQTENAQIFRWVDLDIISPVHFTFPIEKKVAELLQKENYL